MKANIKHNIVKTQTFIGNTFAYISLLFKIICLPPPLHAHYYHS